MTGAITSHSIQLYPNKLAAGLAIFGILVLGAVAASAAPPPRHEEGHRDGGHRDDRGRQSWGGGYYPAPPVVYGWPAQYPPVIYGPGIVLNIR